MSANDRGPGGFTRPEEARTWIEQFIKTSNEAWPARPWPALPEGQTLLIAAFEADPISSRDAHLLGEETDTVLAGAQLAAYAAGCSEITLAVPAGFPQEKLAAAGVAIQTVQLGPCDTQAAEGLPVELIARLGRALAAHTVGNTELVGTIARRRYVTVQGDVRKPGLVEVDPAEPVREVVYGDAGGVPAGWLTGVIAGGYRGVALGGRGLDQPVAEALGDLSPSLLVMTDRTCPVQVISLMVHLAAEEGCQHGAQPALRELDDLLSALIVGKPGEQFLERLAAAAAAVQSSSCAAAAATGNLVRTALDAFPKDFEEHVGGYCRASICQDLFPTPCQNNCPAGVNIPGHISLMRLGKYREALALARVSNPLLISCGYVCESPPCQQVCRRQQIDGHINTPLLHRKAAAGAVHGAADWDQALAAAAPATPLPQTGKRVAIVGAGPAGLAAAFFLARYGHSVKIFEALPEPGGMLVAGIPDYRLPRSVIEIEVDDVKRQGVEIECNRRLGTDFTLPQLQSEYDAVILALGAHKPMRLNLPGEDLPGVFHGVDFLRRAAFDEAKPKVGSRTVIIGGGNVALDCARTAWRLGADEVHVVCLEARDRMTSHESEIAVALEEGIQLHNSFGPEAIIGGPDGVTAIQFRRAEQVLDRQGRFSPRLSATEGLRLEVDSVIIATGQSMDPTGVDDEVLLAAGGRRMAVGSDRVTTALPGVFAAGDCVTGTATVVGAVAEGRRAARAVDRYLGGDPRQKDSQLARYWQWPVPPFPVDVAEYPVAEPTRIPVEERRTLDTFCEEPVPEETLNIELARCLCVARPGPGRHWDA